jgi:transcriptional regulator with XRE-family HTH domain
MKALLIQIGERVREHRVLLGLTQAELAERANLNTSYVGQIERSLREPSLKALCKIAGALNLSLSELLADEIKEADLIKNEVSRLLEEWPLEQQRVILDIVRRLPSLLPQEEEE